MLHFSDPQSLKNEMWTVLNLAPHNIYYSSGTFVTLVWAHEEAHIGMWNKLLPNEMVCVISAGNMDQWYLGSSGKCLQMHHINANSKAGVIRISKHKDWVCAVLVVYKIFNTAIYWGRGKLHTTFWCGILRERDHLEDWFYF